MKNTITINQKMFHMAMEYELGLKPTSDEIMSLITDSAVQEDYCTIDQHMFTLLMCERYSLKYDVDTNLIKTNSYGLIGPQKYFRIVLTEFRKFMYEQYKLIKESDNG
jgi:hypothetical protein